MTALIPDAALAALPETLRFPVETAWSDFRHQAGDAAAGSLPVALLASIPTVWAASPYVAGQCVRRPALLLDLTGSGRLERATDGDELRSLLQAALGDQPAEPELMAALRRFRNREMVRIAWRDIAGWATLDETLMDLSLLAEVCVQETLAVLFRQACALRGTPLDRAGRPQNLVVLAMGKLGAHELNYSSDIDLIFAYRDEGVLPDRKETSYAEFYTRLARSLVKTLDAITEDGIVFRIDTRLRPFGDSGPLVMNFDGMDAYYQSQAREWERYAMVKARTLAGDFEAGRELEKFLLPFVYRRYLDYRALGELRELKQKISRELLRKDRQENVKLGPGGIREIEFIGQAFQLIRGGPEQRLRDRRIQAVLKLLPELGLMPADVAESLRESYRYLRTVENRLQQYNDRQTHDLPVIPAERLALAYAQGHADWDAFKARLDAVRASVHEVFQQVISPSINHGEPDPALQGEPAQIAAALLELGWTDGAEAAELLHRFHEARAIQGLTPRGEAELRRLLPMLLRALLDSEARVVTLERLLGLLEAIASRNVYLTLLAENPQALGQLVKLAEASPWISHTIARYPLLLDELLDPRTLYSPLSKAELAGELDRRLASLDPADQEQRMIALRQFKQANVLRVAAADLSGAIPLMVVSDYLTWIAEILVDAVLREAWRLTVERHGVPPGRRPEEPGGFVVIAYGKLGGIELGYGSDLDLVFLYDGEPTAPTSGDKPVTTAEFFSRVGKRIIHYISTNTPAGILYEVDLRLRPSGNSGLLVSHLDAYETYQMNQAWTWEQQALVKARCIAGDATVGARFAGIRQAGLRRERDPEALRAEVRDMREKMRDNLGSRDSRLFNVKHDFGGIVDIEFLVQFGVLSRAHGDPSLTRWTDVVRLLDALAASGFLDIETAGTLRTAYCEFRDRTHRASLQEAPAVVDAGRYPDLRRFVQNTWHALMES